jgi:hypothetical protein
MGDIFNKLYRNDIENPKFQAPNYKWFDRPFDKLTVLSNVEGLTTLSPVEG